MLHFNLKPMPMLAFSGMICSDSNFDNIIKQVYPDIAQAEAQQEQLLQHILESRKAKTLAQSVEQARTQQMLMQKMQLQKARAPWSPNTSNKRAKTQASGNEDDNDDEEEEDEEESDAGDDDDDDGDDDDGVCEQQLMTVAMICDS